jgi:phospholipase C
MLENRSFDNMLGMLYLKSTEFDGLDGTETNLDPNGTTVQVWNQPGTEPETMRIPDPDPGELWIDINTQLFGTPTPALPLPAAGMGGFVNNYLGQTAEPAARYVAKNIMHYFMPDQVPVISRLARQYAVCDRWFASAPCQTWPNRFFMHTGTAHGYENNVPPHFPYEMETIFDRMEHAGSSWKIYFHDIAQSQALARLWLLGSHFRFYDEFREDAKNGTLPSYSFIEPRYFPLLHLPNDQHPPHVVTLGEQLIADVYNCLRNGPGWVDTLFILTYDEHGG